MMLTWMGFQLRQDRLTKKIKNFDRVIAAYARIGRTLR